MTTKSICLALFFTIATCFATQAQNLKMYVSDAGNFNLPPWQILKFDVTGENGQVFINQHLDWPQDIVFLENDNEVLISNLNSGEIARFNSTTGAYIGSFATGIGGPTRMKVGADGLLYVLQWEGNGKVWRYQLNGNFVDQFTSTGVAASIGLDWDTTGNLYVSSYNGFVQKFSPKGTDLGKFISTNLAGPTNIWFNAAGDLLVNDYNAGIVKRFDSNGVFKGNFITGVPQCEGVNFLADGSILLGVGGTKSVRQYTPNGVIVKTLVPPGTLGLLTPNAVVLRNETTTAVTEPTHTDSETILVTPSVGVQFQWTNSDLILHGAIAEVCNASGVVVKKIRWADSTSWDASDLPNGFYFIMIPLQDQTKLRQKILVQH